MSLPFSGARAHAALWSPSVHTFPFSIPPSVSQENVKPPSKNKDGRFPDFLTHIDPEDDPDATRTLFVGNIDATVSEDEIRHMFKKYGIVEDIDMKRQGQLRQVRLKACLDFFVHSRHTGRR